MIENKYGDLKEENNNAGNISIITEETKPDDDISNSKDLFGITPKELTHIVELYKERADNFGEIKFFEEQAGMVPPSSASKYISWSPHQVSQRFSGCILR